jgi:hypothetical protein
MEIKFKLQAAALNSALEIVSTVPPKPFTPQGATGYLFVVRGERCFVYSQDSLHVSRADFAIHDVEGEGAFIYPSQHIDSFKFAEGEIAFTVTSEGDTHTVKYDLGAGAGGERTTFDPRLLAPCDKELTEATNERSFPISVLRTSMAMSRNFLAKLNDTRVEEHYKTFQIFDGSQDAFQKADGYLFASNSVQAFYFYCDAFKQKGLSIHGQHMPLLTAFLAKCEGMVTIKTGANKTFAEDSKGRILGWAHHERSYAKFSYYALKMDKTILTVPKTRTLNALRYTKTELDKTRDKIRVTFDYKGKTLRFFVQESNGKATSLPVDVKVSKESEERDITTSVNIDHLIELFDGSKAEEVELRIATIPVGDNNPKEKVMFRTIDEFWLDSEGKVVAGSGVEEGKEPEGAFRCKVTRFMPDKS